MDRLLKFTLIQLLVAIVIIGILASLLLPSLSKAMFSLCKNDNRQVTVAVNIFTNDDNEFRTAFSEWQLAQEQPI